ncbi:MAG: hypothetical protein ABJO01_02240 [Parasphingorhabdus sp.]|uniref:hypothetical protein n=1 Tax=Parasphingorhabdus sp. TaxID=2709688 RepID=UPI00329A6436
MRNLLALVSSAAMVAVLPAPIVTASASAKAKDEICMVSRTQGRQGGDKQISIIVKKQNIALMRERGFKISACKGDAAKRDSYKKQICKFASIAPADAQAAFKAQHGASPTELCQATK